jgi:hypothetical protein
LVFATQTVPVRGSAAIPNGARPTLKVASAFPELSLNSVTLLSAAGFPNDDGLPCLADLSQGAVEAVRHPDGAVALVDGDRVRKAADLESRRASLQRDRSGRGAFRGSLDGQRPGVSPGATRNSRP